jgi:ribosomal protein L23
MKYLKSNTRVTMVETVNKARIKRHIPAIYHSRVRSVSWLAISESDKKRKTTANTDIAASTALTIADCINLLILKL